jgi:putative endonuclease
VTRGNALAIRTKLAQGEHSLFVISSAARNLLSAEKSSYVYLLTNWNNKVMYVGVTNDLKRRIYEQQNKLVKGFTEKYNVNKLVYFEYTTDVVSALAREKEIKKWRREKKDLLVIQRNPSWNDLSNDL